MFRCDICGKAADKHHIIHKCEGGLDFPLNFKYLCEEHHRGVGGPHKCIEMDLKYKLELQGKLDQLLDKNYFRIEKMSCLLELNPRILKKLLKNCKIYKEGYKKDDIIFMLMGRKIYDEYMLENYYDFIPIYQLA